MQQVKKSQKTKSVNVSKKTRYGDTIVEAIIAISIYSIVAVLALTMMNSGLSRAQKNLESTMSRLAIDSQSDTLRYIYEGYITGLKRGDATEADFFKKIWTTPRSGMVGANPVMYSAPSGTDVTNVNDAESCEDAIAKDRANYPVFVLNPRALVKLPKDLGRTDAGYYGLVNNIDRDEIIKSVILFDGNGADSVANNIVAAPLYPRLNYKTMTDNGKIPTEYNGYGMNILSGNGGKSGITNADGTEDSTIYLQSGQLYKSEGVWMFGLKRKISEDVDEESYDFYIRTCWNAVGSKAPSTTSTVVRLYGYNGE